MNSDLPLIVPEWPAPANVRAVSSTRSGGVSRSPWHSLNLGDHVGDAPEAVVRNRQLLAQRINLPAEGFAWLRQVHGIGVQEVTRENLAGIPEADASFTREPGVACAILTADCLPVVLCDHAGSVVGAAHAGWRSLCSGVLENLVANMGVPAQNLVAWMGPAIGPNHFEVGPEVRDAFLSVNRQADEAFSVQGARPGHYMANIYRLARQRLEAAGVSSIFSDGFCTATDGDQFYSYRRDGQTGRMATVIWIE